MEIFTSDKFIPASDIESSASECLREYCKKKGLKEIPLPIPIEDIIETMGLILLFDEMEENILGSLAKKGDEKLVCINEAILPENGGHGGRLNFTLAHEVGHYRLHWHFFNPKQGDLLNPNRNMIVCRDFENEKAEKAEKPKKPSSEIQADMFAAFLLMPKDMIIREYIEIAKKDELFFLECTMADKFNVSMQAMCYRLERMGLTKKEAI